MRVAVNIELNDEEHQLLKRLSRSRSTSVRLAERSRIVLLAAQGKTNGEIAEELCISRQKVGRRRDRYHEFGLAGIEKDAPRPGRKKRIASRKVKKIIELTTQQTPDNATHWSRRLMAERMNVSESTVGRIWALHGLKPHRITGFKLSNDKKFQEKLEDVVGLYPPLNAILGFSELLQSLDESSTLDQCVDFASEIHFAGQHLLALVNEVLDLSRIESGLLEVIVEPVALNPLIEHCVAQIESAARRRGIECTLQLDATATVLADPTRLKQVLLNLLSNAVQYNREGGAIRVECPRLSDPVVRVNVHDTGRGLSKDQQLRLFRPFERLDSAYEGIEGTGIGLALAKQLVNAMDGRIGVDSQPGEGSTFWFELPRHDAVAVASDESILSPVSDSPAAENPQRRVLYIEDNPANLRLVQKILAKGTNIELLTVTNGEDGVAMARQTLPDLILLDINLPGMSGYQVLEVLKAETSLKKTPVIAITANAMPRDVERGKTAGFVDYLTKPLHVASFLETIERCFREHPGREAQ